MDNCRQRPVGVVGSTDIQRDVVVVDPGDRDRRGGYSRGHGEALREHFEDRADGLFVQTGKGPPVFQR